MSIPDISHLKLLANVEYIDRRNIAFKYPYSSCNIQSLPLKTFASGEQKKYSKSF